MAMTRADWEQRLQQFGPRVRLPSRIDLQGDEGALRVTLPAGAPSQNMQVDDAAFEAWCLALRACGARRMTLAWDGDMVPDGHVNRFTHRVARFWALFREWFEVAPEHAPSICEMLPPAHGPGGTARWVLNVESSPRTTYEGTDAVELDAAEHKLELAITASQSFKDAFELKHVGRQLPVGVFDRVVTSSQSVFTARKSAIDIWGLSRPSERLALFELKNEANAKAGALSELFFYATLMREVQKGAVRFAVLPRTGEAPTYADICSTRGVDAFILAPRPHPLLSGDDYSILRTLNGALEDALEPIRFGIGLIETGNNFVKFIPVPRRAPAR
jgi:hypothetical protein